MAYCIGACIRYKSRILEESRLRYAYGDKWCCYCSIFMKWHGRDCPCCKTRLRTRPVRNKNLREKAAEMNKAEESIGSA